VLRRAAALSMGSAAASMDSSRVTDQVTWPALGGTLMLQPG